jgi:hypothetical protein
MYASPIPWLVMCFVLFILHVHKKTQNHAIALALTVGICVFYYAKINTTLGLAVLIAAAIYINLEDRESFSISKPAINGDDKSQYLSCRVDSAYCIGADKPPEFNLGVKTVVVKPVLADKVKRDYDIDDAGICDAAANTLTHLECFRNFSSSSGEKRNSVCIVSTIPLDDTYAGLWREPLDKVCDNAPSKWDIIVLAYSGGNTEPSAMNMYESYSPEYDPKVYIIRSESVGLLIKSAYIPESKKFNVVLHNADTAGLNKTLFESLNTYVYKYPLFSSPDAGTKQKQDDLMFDRGSELYKSAEIVVARYNESLDWLKQYPYNKLPVVVYNKGSNDKYYKSPNMIREIKLSNLGKCDHTYIQHIVDNYDKLKDVTVFLTGSLDALPHKLRNSRKIIESLDRDLRSTMVVQYHSDIRKSLANFGLNDWTSSDKRNNMGTAKLYPAEIRPFGKWYEKKFGDLVVNAVAYYGVFSASRDHIKNRALDFYQELLRELSVSQNPEVGHYVERSWLAIFHPMKGVKLLT